MADLTSWATVQAALGLAATQQTEAERLIGVASVRAERHTKRVLAASSETMLLDGPGTPRLDLGQWPINSVASVNIDRTRLFDSATDTDGYTIDSDHGVLWSSSVWPKGQAIIKVVANVGYSSVPADLEESIIQLVGYWIESPQISFLNAQEPAASGGYQTNYVGAMDVPFQVRNVWDSYRRYDVG